MIHSAISQFDNDPSFFSYPLRWPESGYSVNIQPIITDMPWQRNCLYRHINNNTVAFEVIKKFYVKEKDEWSLRVSWWNIGSCHRPYPLTISQRIRLPASALPNWVRMGFSDYGPAPTHTVK